MAMKKRTYLAVAALALSLGFSGCSGSSPQGGAGTVESTGQETTAKQAVEGDSQGPKGARAVEEKENTEGQKEEQETSKEVEASEESQKAAVPVAHSGFLFESNGVTMGMNEDAAPILNGLGDYNNYAETPSCAFKGLDKIYSYNGFDLYTYPKDGTDYINSIYFIDESVSTPEGIRLGSTVEEMLEAYGDSYTEEYGVYTYTKEKSTVSFIVTDGVVESIEYVAITE